MAGPGSDTLVIGIALSALFDLAQSHAVFDEEEEKSRIGSSKRKTTRSNFSQESRSPLSRGF
jgi:hypothetical protein